MSLLRVSRRRWMEPSRSRVAEVGWLIDQQNARVLWSPPEPVGPTKQGSTHAKSVAHCPAVVDLEARLFQVRCPIDAALRISMVDGKPALVNAAGDQSGVRSKHLANMVSLVARSEWRDPQRPILQVATPYVFVADEPVAIEQVPPYLAFREPGWPGILISGRFPIHIWPRPLSWAFEWHNPQRALELRRGEPWFYVRFETADLQRRVRLLEATKTPALTDYMSSISGVTNYVNRTFSLFSEAGRQRPQRLLVRKSDA